MVGCLPPSGKKGLSDNADRSPPAFSRGVEWYEVKKRREAKNKNIHARLRNGTRVSETKSKSVSRVRDISIAHTAGVRNGLAADGQVAATGWTLHRRIVSVVVAVRMWSWGQGRGCGTYKASFLLRTTTGAVGSSHNGWTSTKTTTVVMHREQVDSWVGWGYSTLHISCLLLHGVESSSIILTIGAHI